ncbi:MAG: NAD(P)-dependent oxidoreductase [Paludibaculum sp.]
MIIFGGAGFVGLNVAEALLARGHDVTLHDRAPLPPEAQRSFAEYGARLKAVQGDVTDAQAIDTLIAKGCDAIVLGAAITAGDELERASTARVLEINVMAQIPILLAAIRHGVHREQDQDRHHVDLEHARGRGPLELIAGRDRGASQIAVAALRDERVDGLRIGDIALHHLSRAPYSAKDRCASSGTDGMQRHVVAAREQRLRNIAGRARPTTPKMMTFIAYDPPSQQLCSEIPFRIHVGDEPSRGLGGLTAAARQEVPLPAETRHLLSSMTTRRSTDTGQPFSLRPANGEVVVISSAITRLGSADRDIGVGADRDDPLRG